MPLCICHLFFVLLFLLRPHLPPLFNITLLKWKFCCFYSRGFAVFLSSSFCVFSTGSFFFSTSFCDRKCRCILCFLAVIFFHLSPLTFPPRSSFFCTIKCNCCSLLCSPARRTIIFHLHLILSQTISSSSSPSANPKLRKSRKASLRKWRWVQCILFLRVFHSPRHRPNAISVCKYKLRPSGTNTCE
jgi:hypothetical protein